MKRRVTLKQVAARAGVHLSTVSLALRNDLRLPEATRQRIQKLAHDMGYAPDAGLSALAAYRNAQRPHTVQSGLAFLSDMERDNAFAATVYRHAKEQAARMGYNLIWYGLGEEGVTLERLQAVWWNSGLRGVLIGPFGHAGTQLEADWSRWPTVAFGHSVASPAFNRAVFNHFQNMLEHLEELRARGYRRIGFCLSQELSGRTQGLLHAAYLLDQSRHPEADPIPILRDEDPSGGELDRWVRGQRLDAVISYRPTYDMLVARKWKVPGRLGFSLLSTWGERRFHRQPEFAGFDTQVEVLAATAVSFLVSLIHEQAYGLLHPPRAYMISGQYQEGRTVRPRPRTKRATV